MKKITEKKSRGWFFKPIITDYFITKDEKRFLNETEAEDWEWFLNNKNRILKEYNFTEVSPLSLGLYYMTNPIYSRKFKIGDYSKEKEKELINFFYGLTKELELERWNKYTKESIEFMIKADIKNKLNEWYFFIIDKHPADGDRIYILGDLIAKKENEL